METKAISKKIKDILRVAVNAPSGDNSQPWKFVISKSKLTIVLVKGADDSLYNYKEYGSYFAHGTLIENIILLAPKFGLTPRVTLLPQKNHKEFTAEIDFSYGKHRVDELVSQIAERHTNRKPFDERSLTTHEKSELLRYKKSIFGASFDLLEDRSRIKALSEVLCLNDELLFSNKKIHETIFKIINWTEEEDRSRIKGLFVKTMELNLDQVQAFRRMSNWSEMQKLKKVKVHELIANTSRRLYTASSAYGLIRVSSPTELNFLRAGMLAQKIWLVATSLNLSVHPASGLPYLALRLKSEKNRFFSGKEKKRIIKSAQSISDIFRTNGNTTAFLIRIGSSEPASARSRKLAPKIEEIHDR